ncbi:oligosaccharide repeat unit polymerase [Monaibacterium marinum]|uniref:Oligosaccharide repeat unit polymerase n=1 Tax=Pontivivens marinum TaxID=1690039 RepID=A0A2C9CVP2_9RHOB|nr:oligosaccharide repeat unit polymerase [Monaibacterium marinum]SOH95436.1 oligosaccharide repeat unit polymerase [Monaibacterium marinum]
MIFAVISFALYAILLAGIGFLGVQRARPALISTALILAVLTIFRQFIYYLGLDQPYPQGFFNYTEWNLILRANLVCIAWIVILFSSYLAFTPAAHLFTSLLPSGPNLSVEKPRGVRVMVLAPACFAILGTLYLVLQSGGVAQFLYDSKVAKGLRGLFVFQEATTLASILALYGFIICLNKEKTGIRRISRGSAGYIFIIIASMAVNYIWGNRYNIALMVVSSGIVWHYWVARLNIVKVVVYALLAMAALEALRNLRGELVSSATGRTFSTYSNPWLSLSTALHFVEFDALMLALRDTGHLFDFRHGQDFINGLLSWIPRSIYPEKETFNIGPWFRRVYQPQIINGWPVTTMGAWYVNFGYWGIFLGAALSGCVLRVFDMAFKGLREDPWKAVIGISLAIFMFEGGVNTGFPQKVFLLILPLSWASFWIRLMNRPAPPRSGGK